MSKLIKSHCRIKNNAIDYIIEVPVYTPIGENLIQIPIPIFIKNKIYMLDLSEELLIQKNNELIIAQNCVKNKNNYFCKTLYTNAQNCISGIIKIQNNTSCNYHEILNPILVMKIKNSDLTI